MSDRLLNKNIFSFSPNEIKFKERPLFVEANLRLDWRACFTIFLIDSLSGRTAPSIKKLSFYNWFLLSSERFELLKQAFSENGGLIAASIKHDPNLTRILSYLIGLGLLEHKKSKYALTTTGQLVANQILVENDLFMSEKKILDEVQSKKTTEKFINELFGSN